MVTSNIKITYRAKRYLQTLFEIKCNKKSTFLTQLIKFHIETERKTKPTQFF